VRVEEKACESSVAMSKRHSVIERLQRFIRRRQGIVQKLSLSGSIRREEILANVLIPLVVEVDHILIAFQIDRCEDGSVLTEVVGCRESLG
jgi:hypothetical protein